MQQFLGASSERIEVPALLEHLRELGNLYEAVLARALIDEVKANRELAVCRFENDELGAQVFSGVPLSRGNQFQ